MQSESIRERIKEIRKYYKLNQDDFGKKLGITRSVVVNLELGRAPIKDILIDHMCDIYSINKDWLLSGKGNMLKSNEKIFLDDLVKRFDLDEDELFIIKNYINLPKVQRKNFASILRAMVNIPNTPDDEKTNEEKLRQVAGELKNSDEKRESSASTTTNTTNNITEKRA